MKEQKILRETFSVCPVCLKKVKAYVAEKDGKVVILKECSEHGSFNDVYWSRADIYHKAEKLKKPSSKPFQDNCPYGCGVNECSHHASKTVMAVIDITNECDLRCPICFANAASTNELYEPTLETIHNMLKFLKKQDPPPLAVMFAGGEPLVRDDIVEIVQMAHDLKFMILLATNGLRMSQDPELVRRLKKAGLVSSRKEGRNTYYFVDDRDFLLIYAIRWDGAFRKFLEKNRHRYREPIVSEFIALREATFCK